jgi:hypothetical protein
MKPSTIFRDIDVADMMFSGISGTSFMTLFSYIAANAENEQFREPQLLAALVKRIYTDITPKQAEAIGWALHYMVGCMFTAAYQKIWKRTPLKRNALSGLLLGGISGLIGIAVWHTVFSLHPDPPRTHREGYYKQLFIAHLIFGLLAATSKAEQ